MSTLVPEVSVVASTSGRYRKMWDVGVDAPVKAQVHRTHGRFIANFSDFRLPYPPASVSVGKDVNYGRKHRIRCLYSTIVPIPKGKHGITSDSSNFIIFEVLL